jgi:plasmid stability protein
MSHESKSKYEPEVDPEAKRRYFIKLGGETRDALRLHREHGLWDRAERGAPRDWGNVSEHCLAEVARVSILGEMLKLPDDVIADLKIAAALHDFYKKAEIQKLRANGTSWEAYSEAGNEAKAILEGHGFTARQVALATSAGHETIPEAEALANKPNLTAGEVAWLIMHYTDDYTIESDWVTPATQNEDGTWNNDLRRRMQKNLANAQPGGKYHGIHLAGNEHLGEPTYDAQLRVGQLVENRLASLVGAQTGMTIEPVFLPEIVDQGVAAHIEAQGA